MDIAALVARFARWRAKHARSAFLPRLGVGGRSRFGGSPEMRPGEPWPVCAGCRAPMLFLLQLDLARLPRDPGRGLLQLFYCSTDDGRCETWAPFSGANLARVVDGELVRQKPPVAVQPERGIVDWDAIEDLPNAQEHEELGIQAHYDHGKKTVRVVCAELGLDVRDLDYGSVETISSARTGDKLYGWPAWIQGAEYPRCPTCDARMELVFQVDSERGVAFMFGDCGIGHITRCPTHPDVVAFGWACS